MHLQGFSARIAASEEGAGFRSVADLVTASARAGGFSGIIAPEIFDCNLHIIYCNFLFSATYFVVFLLMYFGNTIIPSLIFL